MGAFCARAARWVALAFFACGTTLLLPSRASADSLTADEEAKLSRGEVVRRPVTFDKSGLRHIGGVAYAVVHAPIADVRAVLLDVRSYPKILPLTLEARQVAHRDGDRWVYLRQGGRVATASYTVMLRNDSKNSIRFWLDPTRPHDVEDAWGFFRLEAIDSDTTLVSYGAIVCLGTGIAQWLFEDKIRHYVLEPPTLVRRFVEEQQRGRPSRPVRLAGAL